MSDDGQLFFLHGMGVASKGLHGHRRVFQITLEAGSSVELMPLSIFYFSLTSHSPVICGIQSDDLIYICRVTNKSITLAYICGVCVWYLKFSLLVVLPYMVYLYYVSHCKQ